MPTNIWNHHVQLGDLLNDFDETQHPIETTRDAVVTRLREHPFHTEHAGDIVLRSLLDDLAKADTLEGFNRELRYLYMWADQDGKRVWLCTMTGCADCVDAQRRRDEANAAAPDVSGAGAPKPRTCFWIDPAQDPADHGGYVPSLVTEDAPGHAPLTGNDALAAAYTWGSDLETAKHVCDEQNASTYGLSTKEALEIVLSSQRASRRGKTA
jgi:hypothetical protein